MREKILRVLLPTAAANWVRERLSPAPPVNKDAVKARRWRLLVLSAVIFAAAFGIRAFHRADDPHTLNDSLGSLVRRYQNQADGVLAGEGVLFPRVESESGHIQKLVHPPGYPIFVASVYTLFGHSQTALAWMQIILNALAAVVLFLLVAELLPLVVAFLASALAAFSPQLAIYSAVLLPDSLVALPILAAVYLLVLCRRKPIGAGVIAAGALVGASVWLRSNSMLLAFFLAAVIWLTFEGGRSKRNALLFLLAALATVLPITIRNWVVFDSFVPVSLGAGITLVEGIGDYDEEKRFGMPTSDAETRQKDAEWHARPDYEARVWRPDGIKRDRYRFTRGLAVVRENPFWFLSVMGRRAATMVRYNDSTIQGWPADTSQVSLVSAASPSRLATPFRGLVRRLQKDLFKTGRMRVLIVAGVLLLGWARKWRELLVLLAVPLYYLSLQSAFHTEYRYALAIHFFLFVAAAVTVSCAATLLLQGARQLWRRLPTRA